MGSDYDGVWVFNGDAGQFAGGVFSSLDRAEAWIAANKLSGVPTLFPLDTGVYEWAITRGWFTPRQEKHSSAEFIGSFTTASMAHHHYEQGERDA